MEWPYPLFPLRGHEDKGNKVALVLAPPFHSP